MKELPGVKLSNTVMFDYPTIDAIAGFALSQFAPAAGMATLPMQMSDFSVASSEALAVLGMACRFPGRSDSPEVYWSKLLEKTNGVVEIPGSRWDVDEVFDPQPGAVGKMYVRRAAFIDDIELFAASFFGISAAEAKTMDPQQRLLLEVTYDAFYRAGDDRRTLMGLMGGVFVGQCNNDWGRIDWGTTSDKMNPFTGTGMSASISANRISYTLGLKGPSMTIDTACSSSLVALDNAVQALRRGRCSIAVAAGVNLNLIAGPFIACCQANMLSPDGHCKTFDASANGYARGEGSGAVILKRLSDAEKEGAAVLGLVRGTAVNQDGRSSSLTAPNGPSQQEVIHAALLEAQVAANELDYVECHGTGTPLGDPIEVGALKAVLGTSRNAAASVVLGAVKSNVGHLEGAAGVAGLIKAVYALRHKNVPANLHYAELNPHIDVEDFPAIFPTEAVALPQEKALVAGLSSFGFGGTNAHLIIGEAPASSAAPVEQPEKKEKKVAFLFTGQGSQYVGMGKELYEKDDTFRAALDKCAELSKDLLPTPLFDVIFAADSTLLDQTQYSQPAIFSIEYALSEMWKAKGVTPAYVLGHSVGEFAAAVTAGIMSVEDGMRLIAARGRLMTTECEAGMGGMKAVFSPQADVEKAIDAVAKKNPNARERVAIAGINGPKMCVVSGDQDLVDQVCEATGAGNRALNVSHAFHSPLMAPMLEPFRAEVSTATFKKVSGTRMISTLKGAEIAETDTDYWVDHVKSAVRFLAGMKMLEAEGVETYLEIGSMPTLLGMGKRCFSSAAEWVPSLDKGKGDLSNVAKAAESVCIPVTRPPLVYNRQAFPWQEVRHPLLGKKSAEMMAPLPSPRRSAVSSLSSSRTTSSS